MTRTVEFALVGAIIAFIALLSGYAVLSARSQTRDVTRLANVRELQMALELYFQGHSSYPVAAEPVALGQALTSCLSQEGFTGPCPSNGPTPYLSVVMIPPAAGLHERIACEELNNVYCFSGSEDQYRIGFELERGNAILGVAKGANCLTEQGFVAGECEAL